MLTFPEPPFQSDLLQKTMPLVKNVISLITIYGARTYSVSNIVGNTKETRAIQKIDRFVLLLVR